MADNKRRLWLLAMPIGLVIGVLILVIVYQLRQGIRVTVENSGTTPLRSVVVHVTGASYSLGDIAPGASAATPVNPTSESGLEIQFEDADGQTRRLNAGGYFESGYRGTIRVGIKDGKFDKNEQDIKLW